MEIQGLSLPRGDGATYDLTVRDQNKAILPLTAAKVWFTLKEKYADVDASASIQLDSSDSSKIEIYDAAAGKCYIKVKNAHTQNLTPGSYVYDVQVKRSNGDIRTVLWGTFAILDDVTRAVA